MATQTPVDMPQVDEDTGEIVSTTEPTTTTTTASGDEAYARSKMFQKICEVMKAVRRLEKDGENTFDRYRYMSNDQIVAPIGGAMAHAGLVLVPAMTNINTDAVTSAGGKPLLRTLHTPAKRNGASKQAAKSATRSAPKSAPPNAQKSAPQPAQSVSSETVDSYESVNQKGSQLFGDNWTSEFAGKLQLAYPQANTIMDLSQKERDTLLVCVTSWLVKVEESQSVPA